VRKTGAAVIFTYANVERFQDVIASDLDEWIYLLKHSALRADFKAKNIDTAGESFYTRLIFV
jgi:hypothetical protein